MSSAWPDFPSISLVGSSKADRVKQRIEKLAQYFNGALDALGANAALEEHAQPLSLVALPILQI